MKLNKELSFANILSLFFFLLGLLIIKNHEIWRDEMQSWLIAKESTSIVNLFYNIRYEGHPGLWYLTLLPLSRFFASPLAMQLFHLFLATSVVYLFVKYSVFSKLQKILFVFGYFPFYEYGVISRNYSLGILLIFSFCLFYKTSKNKNLFLLSSILFFLSQTNICGLIIAIALGAMLFWEYISDGELRSALAWRKTEVIGSILIFFTGVAVSVLQLIPPSDSCFRIYPWRFNIEGKLLSQTITTIWNAYFPIPEFNYQFWGTNILNNMPILKLVFSLLIFGFALLIFARKPLIFLLYLIGTLGLLAFFYLKFFGSIRHHGHLFILFIACLWLTDYYPEKEIKFKLIGIGSDFCLKYKDKFLLILLGAQLIAGVYAGGMDLYFPFSGGEETARYIKEKQMEAMDMVGDMDQAVSTIAGYLNRKIYYPTGDRLGSYAIWTDQRTNRNTKGSLAKADFLANQSQKDILVIFNYKIFLPEYSKYHLVKIYESRPSIVDGESFYLYKMKL